MERIIAVSTMVYDDHPIDTALRQLAALGCRWTELAAVTGVAEHIQQKDMTADYAKYVRGQMEKFGLSSVALSGHVDLSEAGIVPLFKSRMEFAKNIGAKIINTNSGPKKKLPTFYENIFEIAEVAEDLDITVALETHGDIIDSGESIVRIIEHIGSSHVKINYDFANVLYFSKGSVRPEQDILTVMDHVVHLHIKDFVWGSDGRWRFTVIGQGLIHYERVFNSLRAQKWVGPVTLETPPRLMREVTAGTKNQRPPKIAEMDHWVKESLGYIERYWEVETDQN